MPHVNTTPRRASARRPRLTRDAWTAIGAIVVATISAIVTLVTHFWPMRDARASTPVTVAAACTIAAPCAAPRDVGCDAVVDRPSATGRDR